MSDNPLGEYLERLRRSHPRLSMRQMSLGASLSENAVAKIINGEMRPSPETLKAITDRWGSDDDYVVMMELAGHPVVQAEAELRLTVTERKLLDALAYLSPDERGQVQEMLEHLTRPGAVVDALMPEKSVTPGERAQADRAMREDSGVVLTAGLLDEVQKDVLRRYRLMDDARKLRVALFHERYDDRREAAAAGVRITQAMVGRPSLREAAAAFLHGSPEIDEMVEMFRTMTPEDRRTALALVRALLDHDRGRDGGVNPDALGAIS